MIVRFAEVAPGLFRSGRYRAHTLRNRATGRVQVREVVGWPDPYKTLALETRYDTPVWDVDWSRVETLIIGGETSGLPARVPAAQTAVIPMAGLVSGLTVEAALAIALHEWGRWRRGK